MASLIESVRRMHGPTLVEHDNGYDVDVICPECTRLRTQALEQASSDSEEWVYGPELAHVPYPCRTRIVAGTVAADGKDESARMRLEHLVVRREELEERMERLEAVIGLIRRSLGEASDANVDENNDRDELEANPPTEGEQSSQVEATPSAVHDENSEDEYDF